MPDVRMPDGAVVRFPNDMPPDQIRGLILQKFPELGSNDAASAPRGGSQRENLKAMFEPAQPSDQTPRRRISYEEAMQLPRRQISYEEAIQLPRRRLLSDEEIMPSFELQAGGRTFEMEAPDMQAAIKAAGQIDFKAMFAPDANTTTVAKGAGPTQKPRRLLSDEEMFGIAAPRQKRLLSDEEMFGGQHASASAQASQVHAGDLARSFVGQGMAAGFGDEIEAFARSLMGGSPYDDELKSIREGNARFAQEQPFLSVGSELAGALTSMLVPGLRQAGCTSSHCCASGDGRRSAWCRVWRPLWVRYR